MPTTTTTPTPWYLLSGHIISRSVTADHSSEKNLIVPGGILSREIAEQIVSDHNSHAALVAALEHAYAQLLEYSDQNGDFDHDGIAMIENALAQERKAP